MKSDLLYVRDLSCLPQINICLLTLRSSDFTGAECQPLKKKRRNRKATEFEQEYEKNDLRKNDLVNKFSCLFVSLFVSATFLH